MSEIAEVKSATDTLARAFEEFKSANDQRLKEIEAKGAADPVTETKIAKLNEALDAAQAKMAEFGKVVSRVEGIEVALRRPESGDPAKAAKSEIEVQHQKAFELYLRKGVDHGLAEAQQKALSVGSDPDGGYVVTPDMNGRIVRRVFETSPIRQIANVVTISTDALEGIRDTDEAGAGWVGETSARGTSSTPQLGKWRIVTHEMFAKPEATQKLLDDANINMEEWLAEKVADRMSRLENTAFVSGTGVTSPRGFTTYPTAATADATRGWGTIEHVPSGVTASFGTTGDPLFDLIASVKPQYLADATFVTRRTVIRDIRKLKGTGNDYLWQPGLQAGQPDRLLGYPILLAEDMPAIGTNSLSLFFGNFRLCYQIVDRQGIRTLRDPFSNKPYVQFYTTRRVGADVVQFEAIKALRFGTA